MTDAVIEAMVRAILLSVFGVAAERDDERDAETIAADAARAAYLAGQKAMRKVADFPQPIRIDVWGVGNSQNHVRDRFAYADLVDSPRARAANSRRGSPG